MHGGIIMTMNEKERGMKCGRKHRNRTRWPREKPLAANAGNR